jgi:hypothetical protein
MSVTHNRRYPHTYTHATPHAAPPGADSSATALAEHLSEAFVRARQYVSKYSDRLPDARLKTLQVRARRISKGRGLEPRPGRLSQLF